jgi:DNA-binding beta-propeller fold protein YncE
MSTSRSRSLLALVALSSSLAGCGNGAAAPDLKKTKRAIVNTSHYNPDFSGNGILNTVSFPGNQVQLGIDATLDPDTFIHVESDTLYMVNEDTGSVRLYDPASFTVRAEISTGGAGAPNGTSFPHEIYVAPGTTKIYVALSGNDAAHAVGVLDTAQPNAGVVKYITIPAADPDGKPEATNLYACQGKLYVTLLDYTLSGTTVTYQAGRIGVIDLATDSFEGVIQLVGQNPSAVVAASKDATSCGSVLVLDGGQLQTVPDGTAGIEAVDLTGRSSAGLRIADTALGGRPDALALASARLGFVAIYFDPQKNAMGDTYLASTKVVKIDPQAGTLLGDISGKAGNINFVRVSPDGQLFVGAGLFAGTPATDKLAQGLYLGPADGTMLPMAPIDLGQTPAAIGFQSE